MAEVGGYPMCLHTLLVAGSSPGAVNQRGQTTAVLTESAYSRPKLRKVASTFRCGATSGKFITSFISS